MSLDVLKQVVADASALEVANSALKSQVSGLNEQVTALQAEVNKAKADTKEAVAAGQATADKLNAIILERGEKLQDALNALTAANAELSEVKQAYAELSEKS